MTRYGRATGPFKDPNVFGPFLVPALVYGLSRLAGVAAAQEHSPARPAPGDRPGHAAELLAGGMDQSGRGDGDLRRAPHPDRARQPRAAQVRRAGSRWGSRPFPPWCWLPCSSTRSSGLASERASLDQSYDEGPEGRFGGQQKAAGLILEHPFGIGAQQFVPQYHHEEPHNVYLTMFLNAGWLGGLLFLSLVVSTGVWGLRHAFVRYRHPAALPGGLRLLRRPRARRPRHRPRPLAPLLSADGAGLGPDAERDAGGRESLTPLLRLVVGFDDARRLFIVIYLRSPFALNRENRIGAPGGTTLGQAYQVLSPHR